MSESRDPVTQTPAAHDPYGVPRDAALAAIAPFAAAVAERYAVEREIGRGGMATVFLARDVRHDRLVALKVLNAELAAELGAERFLAEIRVTANLQHPHILPLLDSGDAAGRLFYVMPYVEGETLRVRLEREGALPLGDAVRLGAQLAAALDYAHARGVVHRDIKPENILLSHGLPVLADFGIAYAARRAGAERLTVAGTSLGTPAYMSPEQATGDAGTDARADLYAWGVIVHELLAGAHPFAGRTAYHELLMAHLLERPASVTERRPDCPPAVAALVRRCLEKDPADRPARAGDLVDVLEQAWRSGATTPPAATERPSIAVLPFENLSPDEDNAFFADGLTEEVIADLSRVKALRVISRTSSMQYRGRAKGLPAVARELGVRYVLEGSVRRAGSALRVTAQLIDAATDAHLWAEKYAGALDDVFDLQERLSRKIVEALEVTLTPEEDRRLAARPVPNVHAYECYLKAQREILSFTTGGFERAFALLDRGLELAGENALLYAARSYAYTHLIGAGLSYDDTNLDRAEEDARRALALDPEVAQAHFALAYAAAQRGEFGRALPHFRRAETLDPTSTDTAFWFGVFLAFAGRADEARQRAERLSALAPNSDVALELGLLTATLVGDWDAALAQWDRMLARGVAPDAFSVNSVAVLVLRTRRAADGVAHLEQADDAMRATVVHRNAIFVARARAGDEAGALAMADDEHLAVARRDCCGAWLVASSYALLGHVDTAIAWLDIAAERGFLHHRFLAEVDPFFAPLRDDPRFVAVVGRVRRRREGLGV